MNIPDETRAQLDTLMRDGVAWFWQSPFSELRLTKSVGDYSLCLSARIESCTRLRWEIMTLDNGSFEHEPIEGFNPQDGNALSLLAVMVNCLALFAQANAVTPIVSFELFQKTCNDFLGDDVARRYDYESHHERFEVELGALGDISVTLWYGHGYATMSLHAYSAYAAQEQMENRALIEKAHGLMVHLNKLWGVRLRE